MFCTRETLVSICQVTLFEPIVQLLQCQVTDMLKVPLDYRKALKLTSKLLTEYSCQQNSSAMNIHRKQQNQVSSHT